MSTLLVVILKFDTMGFTLLLLDVVDHNVTKLQSSATFYILKEINRIYTL